MNYMYKPKGFFEELEIKNKDYPESQTTNPLAQVDYIENLIHFSGRKIGDRFSTYLEKSETSLATVFTSFTKLLHHFINSFGKYVKELFFTRHLHVALPN